MFVATIACIFFQRLSKVESSTGNVSKPIYSRKLNTSKMFLRGVDPIVILETMTSSHNFHFIDCKLSFAKVSICLSVTCKLVTLMFCVRFVPFWRELCSFRTILKGLESPKTLQNNAFEGHMLEKQKVPGCFATANEKPRKNDVYTTFIIDDGKPDGSCCFEYSE